MAASKNALPTVRVVQLIEALSTVDVNNNSIELVQKLSKILGGTAYPISVPLILTDQETARSLRILPEVAASAKWYDQIDFAVAPVGSDKSGNSQLYEAVLPNERELLISQGVVADSCALMFGTQGHKIRSALLERAIAMPGKKRRKGPEVISVANASNCRITPRRVHRDIGDRHRSR